MHGRTILSELCVSCPIARHIPKKVKKKETQIKKTVRDRKILSTDSESLHRNYPKTLQDIHAQNPLSNNDY